MLEDFVVFGTSTADPWNRINCCHYPVLVLIEFCQLQGPKPIIWRPENPGAHMDLDHVAIWLMSSDNVHGSTIIVFNQQMGVYALVRHSTVLDVTARAFQRPFCLALLSSSKPNIKIVSRFESVANELLSRLLECNRRLFSRFLNHMINLEESLHNEDFQKFYAFLPPDGPSSTFSNKIRSVAKQAKKLNHRFHQAYNMSVEYDCQCGVEYEDLFEYFPFLEQPNCTRLMPLLNLAPCVKDFDISFQYAYDSLIDSTRSRTTGILFSNGIPVFRSMPNHGMISSSLAESIHSTSSIQHAQKENVLRSLSPSLVHCLHPLLAGERITILASKQRKFTGVDLMHKFNEISIKKKVDTVQWSDDDNDTLIIPDERLRGISCNRDQNMAPIDCTIIDLNNHYLRTRPYNGNLLYPLIYLKNFPSDKSFMHYISTVFTDICQVLCLVQWVGKFDPKICNLLNLSLHDQQIITNLLQELDLPKYSEIKQRIDTWMKELPQKSIKL